MKTLREPYTGKVIRKLTPYTIYWEKLANSLARRTLHIRPCQKCGGPVIEGYCCGRCGTDDP